MSPPIQPQPRHIEAACKIVDEQLSSYYVSPRSDKRFDLRDIIARALADAENRAAWRVWEECAKTMREFIGDHNEIVYGCRDLADGSLSIVPAEYMSDYGPRPIDAAKEVG